MIALGHLCAVTMLLGKLEGRLKEVDEQPGGTVKTRDCPSGGQSFEAPIAQELPYDGSVLLLDPRLVVLAVGAGAGEFDSATQAILDQPVVHELGAVVHVKGSQGERQALADPLERFNHQRTLSDNDRSGLCPSTRDVGQDEAVHIASAVDRSTMRHQIHFHAARRWLIPVGKRAHSDAPSRLWHDPRRLSGT